MKKTLLLITALVLPISAHAIPMNYEFEWTGENGYTMTGMFTGEDTDGDSRITDEEVTSLLFEGFANGNSLSTTNIFPTASSSFNFNFSLSSNTFRTGGNSNGNRGQRWNVDGPGLGFQNGINKSFLISNGDTVHGSRSGNPADYTVNKVPEPTSIALLGLGGLVMGAGALRRRKKA